MVRSLVKIVALSLLVVVGAAGIYRYHARNPLGEQVQQLEQEKKQLQQIVQRLTDEQRVAEVLVTDQQAAADGTVYTTLLFVEYAKDGTTLPPKSFTIEGKTAHIDALVVKFEQDFVKQNDPLRGRSVALFTRLYGEKQTPASAFPIDAPGRVPDVYRGADPKVTAFEQELWQNFWRLAEDAEYRAKHGVRVANGQGVWGPFEPNRVYTITLETSGGLNISSKPVPGIYREAMRHREEVSLAPRPSSPQT